MIAQPVLNKILNIFPNVKIQYKNQSIFMKILGIILFFNKSFMTQYVTTIGSTIYFPSEKFVNLHPATSFITLLHELVHVNDSVKVSRPVFSILYILPQILVFLAIPLFFISWKIALPFLIFAAPIPAYFRMIYEKRAYIASLYVMDKLNSSHGYKIDLDEQAQFFVQQFKTSAYYFAWPFSNLDKDFAAAVTAVKAGQRPYNDPIFDILDQIIAVF